MCVSSFPDGVTVRTESVYMDDPLYQYSWLILFAPLFAFVVIVFGTRVWDLLSRPRVAATTTHAEHHAVEAHGSEGEDHGEHGEDDDDDPKVPHLTAGAK